MFTPKIYLITVGLLFCFLVISFPAIIPAQVLTKPPSTYLSFNGTDSFAEIPNSADFSVGKYGLTVMAWINPMTLWFPNPVDASDVEKHYVYPIGKGEPGQYEWAFRMYSDDVPDRPSRISFYVFNLHGGEGCGSYFQDDLKHADFWIHVTGVIDAEAKTISIYKNGDRRHTHTYFKEPKTSITITPQHGLTPLRLGKRNGTTGLFEGRIGDVWIWDRPLTDAEIKAFYQSPAMQPKNATAHYSLTEGRGNRIKDSTGKHPDGILHGARWSTTGLQITKSSKGSEGGGC